MKGNRVRRLAEGVLLCVCVVLAACNISFTPGECEVQCGFPEAGVAGPTCPGELKCQLSSKLCVAPAHLDAGTFCSSVIDAGLIDAGLIDASPIDAGLIDAGPVDAGPSDAGIDAGPASNVSSAWVQHSCRIIGTGFSSVSGAVGGEIQCWGDNEHLQLGSFVDAGLDARVPSGVGLPSPSPLTVNEASESDPWLQVSAGARHTCAVSHAGRLFCWGDNTSNAVSDGALADQTTLVETTLGDGGTWLSVAAGDGFTCAIRNISSILPNEVYCWGRNDHGELGSGQIGAPQGTPTEVMLPGSTFPEQITVGRHHACALTSNSATDSGADEVYCWGSNADDNGIVIGQASPSDTTDAVVMPTIINDPEHGVPFRATSISAGYESTCAVLTLGGNLSARIECWGENTNGELGGTTPGANLEVLEPPTNDPGSPGSWVAVAVGHDSACGIFQSETPLVAPVVYCWGVDQNGARGVVDFTMAPVLTPLPIVITPVPLTPFVPALLTAGDYFGCAYDANGNGYCWGDNHRGQLGQLITQGTPSKLPMTFTGPVKLTAGNNHTCALGPTADAPTPEAQVFCWGLNEAGEVSQSLPTDLASYRHVQAVTELRKHTSTAFKQPTFVAAGAQHTCVESEMETQGGKLVACWGDNHFSQLPTADGVSLGADQITSEVTGLAFSVAELSSGSNLTCIVSDATPSSTECWGYLPGNQTQGDTFAQQSMPKVVTALSMTGAPVNRLGIATNAIWGTQNNGGFDQPGFLGIPLTSATGDTTMFETFATLDGDAPPIVSTATAQAVAVGTAQHRCFIDSNDQEMYCAGPSQLGMNDTGAVPGASGEVDVTRVSKTYESLASRFTTSNDSSTPVLAVGGDNTCALTGSGDSATNGANSLYCWGDKTFEQLSNADTDGSGIAPEINVPSNLVSTTSETWVNVAIGARHVCATLRVSFLQAPTEYDVYCWGDGTNGQLGTIDNNGTEPSFQRLPTELPLLSP